MNMTKLLAWVFLSLLLSGPGLVFADIPERFIGTWIMEVDTSPGFPWWDQIKHPVRLSITKDAINFDDQAGCSCTPKAFFYDDELDALVFKHCLPTKSDLAFTPFYRMKSKDRKLVGEVWTYKLLFKLYGHSEQKQ
jgi:hypothetical protein